MMLMAGFELRAPNTPRWEEEEEERRQDVKEAQSGTYCERHHSLARVMDLQPCSERHTDRQTDGQTDNACVDGKNLYQA